MYAKLAEAQAVTCAATKVEVPAVPAPSVVVIDVRSFLLFVPTNLTYY